MGRNWKKDIHHCEGPPLYVLIKKLPHKAIGSELSHYIQKMQNVGLLVQLWESSIQIWDCSDFDFDYYIFPLYNYESI